MAKSIPGFLLQIILQLSFLNRTIHISSLIDPESVISEEKLDRPGSKWVGSRFMLLFRGESMIIQAGCQESYEHIMAKCAKAITTHTEPDAGAVDWLQWAPDQTPTHLWSREQVFLQTQQSNKCRLFFFLFLPKGRQFINIPHLNQASVQGKILSSIAVFFAFPWGFARWWSPNSRSWEQAIMSQACGFCIFSIARWGVYRYVSEDSVYITNCL